MQTILDWKGETIDIAESKSGVRATCHPWNNLIKPSAGPWPTPEILQKLYSSSRVFGKTEADRIAATRALGYYCDLQSLNSEDAITWSVIGPVIYESTLLQL